MRFGPGTVLPYAGEPPQYRRGSRWWETRVWECDRCGVSVPAGAIPFPHTGDCPPGIIVVSRFSWDLRCWRFRGCLDEIGDDVARLFTAPASYTRESAGAPA